LILDTAAVGGSDQAHRHSVTSGAPSLRLNLPVTSELSKSNSEIEFHSGSSSPLSSSNAVLRRHVASAESSASKSPSSQEQPQQTIELGEIEMPSTDDISESQSLLSSHLARDYTKLESTQINEGNILRSGDRLIFSAKLENLQHLRHLNVKGLSIGDSVLNGFHDVDSEFIELVVSHRCPHIGKAINSR
jgi:hypothetical protein